MSDTILSGDFTVYYTNDTGGDKQIRWSGSSTGTRDVSELYLALQDLFDNVNQMDEGVPMSAQTPTAYTIGEIETYDDEAWFIDPVTIQHLQNGAITSTGWTRNPLPGDGTGSIGILRFDYTVGAGTDFVSGDLGRTISSTNNGCSGTLLYFETDGSNGTAWVRPDSNAAANDWDNSPAANDIAASGGTGTGLSQDAAATTGEQLWSNVFTIGTQGDNTRIYVTQDNIEIPNWWGDGPIDILVLVQDQDALIDSGNVTLYARQYSDTYDYSVTDLSGGGRTPVALSTQNDLNNQTGTRSVAVSGASSTFSTGEVVTGGTSGAKGVVLSNTGSPTTSFTYYLIGDKTNYINGDALTGSIVGSNGTAATPSTTGPAGWTDITVTFGINATYDINNDSTNEEYSIVIDCNNRSLLQVYERLKYITRRSSTENLNGVEGQQYIGIDRRIDYNTLSGTLSTGDFIQQQNTGATAYIVAHSTTNNYLMVRDTTGTFNTTDTIEEVGTPANNVTMTGGSIEIITPTKTSPFGSFAGGTFIAARGVVLDNVQTSEANNYQAYANDGIFYEEPVQVAFSLTNIQTDSEVRIFNDAATNFFLDKEITGTEGTTSQLTGVLIADGGTGYSVSDVLTITGGTFTTAAQLTVTSVNSGVITGVSISNAGSGYSANPSNPASTTGGSGAGATFNLTFTGSFIYQYTYTSDIPITYIVFHLNYKDIRQSGTLSDTSQSIPITQITDRNYLNP